MKWHWLISIVSVVVVVSSCKSSTQKIEPAGRGKRGESCQARNDCASGLACISFTCSKNDFNIDVSAKHCDRVDCKKNSDCCGNKPTQAPARCNDYDKLCQSTIATCSSGQYCEDDNDCGGGTCEGYGYCSKTYQSCNSDNDCYAADVCSGGYCTVTGLSCADNSGCLGSDVCSGNYCTRSGAYCNDDSDCYSSDVCNNTYLTCNCSNPDYNPTDDLCSDSDCFDICLLRCEDERCVQDTSCDNNDDCGSGFCQDDRCVECRRDSDCDEDNDELCVDGRCERGCEEDEECPLFNECDDGECIPVGCKSDRECVLAASRGGTEGAADDARLYQCLPSDIEGQDYNVCKIPCENDGACNSDFQVCDKGFCKFIGCQNDEDCRAYLGLSNEEVTDAKPYVSKAVCRE